MIVLSRVFMAFAVLAMIFSPLMPTRQASAAPETLEVATADPIAALPTRTAGTPVVETQALPTATTAPARPSVAPTSVATSVPSVAPKPSTAPSAAPSVVPSVIPSVAPAPAPAPAPQASAAASPAPAPSVAPSVAPSSSAPSAAPSAAPVTSPNASPSAAPSVAPVASAQAATPGARATPRVGTPIAEASASPSPSPSASPSPSPSPSASPSPSPSAGPELPFDPRVPAGPLEMPGDGKALQGNGDWRTAVITEAQKYIGVPYVWGAQSPSGWDCSGFVLWIFQKAAGVTLPRVAGDQAGVGVNVSPANIQPGDLVFFVNTYAPGISHVGIALGNGRFIHASSLGTAISSLGEPYYQQHFAGARRPLAEVPGGSASIAPGVPLPAPGPAVAPSQLLPTFEKASKLTGVPKEVLLAIGKVESGFDPRAIGPYLPQFAGTENQHALGMMQFLPSSYRPYASKIDGITGKNLGMMGIWDAESSIYASAFYLVDHGAPGDMRRALFSYNNADWYVTLILNWAANYAGGLIGDPNFNLTSGGQASITVAPENALQATIVGRHVDALSPLPLYLPFKAGESWYVGGDGSFYGEGEHNDANGLYYSVDFNKGTWQHPEADEGEPVLAAADGLINNVYATTGGGWTVEMYHRSPQGTILRTLYMHLRDDPRVTAGLKTNQMVPHGTTIGFVGNTGSTSTGAHLHFALSIWQDNGWASIRPEPMEGQALKTGLALVSHNDPTDKAAFDAAWNATDSKVYTNQRQSWLWGPQPFTGSLLEGYGKDTTRVVQYWDKGRMERVDDGKGGFFTSVGKLAWEMLTGKVDLGDGQSTEIGAAKIPLVGPVTDTDRNIAALALGQPLPDKLAPTYADAGIDAAARTIDFKGVPVTWILRPGGKLEAFPAGVRPPGQVLLTNYDATSGHNVADVFARWYDRTFFTSPDGDPAHTLNALLQNNTQQIDPGHPLTDPFWVEVTLDGVDRYVLVQVFERWTLTYSPQNPDGWQIEIGNVGLHYYQWRYEEPLREATLTQPDRNSRRRRTDWLEE